MTAMDDLMIVRGLVTTREEAAAVTRMMARMWHCGRFRVPMQDLVTVESEDAVRAMARVTVRRRRVTRVGQFNVTWTDQFVLANGAGTTVGTFPSVQALLVEASARGATVGDAFVADLLRLQAEPWEEVT